MGVGNGPFFLMKIKAVRNVAINGQHMEAGEIREINDVDGAYLIRNNKAIEAPEIPEAPACPPEKPKPAAKKAKTNGAE